MGQVKFGTDGWRGIIADDFTYDNVRSVARAIAAYVLKHEDSAKGVVVGYDTRFASPAAAKIVAEVVAAAGVPVTLASDACPTPAVSYAVKRHGAAGGIIVTSSHNPWNWNGMKFKGRFGGSATPAIMQQIEVEMNANTLPEAAAAAPIIARDLRPEYVEAICKFADIDKIAKAKFRFVIDTMYGSGTGVLAGIFEARGIEFVPIRDAVNPLFPGINPEPIELNLVALQEAVVRERCHAGFATDGDADRLGAVAEDGRFVDAHKIFCVLLRWLLVRKQWPGDVVRAFNTTLMLDRICAKYGRTLIECPIGFKYIADLMMDGNVLIGGEESGGIGYAQFLPERDGVLNSLLLANVMADEAKPLGVLVDDLQREYGRHEYGRVDLHVPEEQKQDAIRRAKADDTTKLGSFTIQRKATLDGIKFFLDAPRENHGADAWVLFRASGTEPLLRVYCEASSPELVQEILASAKEFIGV